MAGNPVISSINQFIIKLVKMWPGRTLHVMVGTLKITVNRLKKGSLLVKASLCLEAVERPQRP